MWEAHSNGGWWYVTKGLPSVQQVLSDKRGRYLRFHSFEAAQRRALRENNK